MMSEIEDLEAQQAAKPDVMLTPALQIAIKNEISSAVQKATMVLQQQIKNLQDREREALDSLANSEQRANDLNADLELLKQRSERERTDAEKNQIATSATIAILEKTLKDRDQEKQELFTRLESAHLKEAKIIERLEHFERAGKENSCL